MNGYTSIFDKGRMPTLAEFVDICSHACIGRLDRDGSLSSPVIRRVECKVPECEKSLAAAQAQLTQHLEKSNDEWLADYEVGMRENRKWNAESTGKKNDMRGRIARMRQLVTAWQPSSRLDDLKKFMLDQLDECEKWDCTVWSHTDITFDAYITHQREWAEKQVKQCQERLDERVKYEAEANAWLDVLHNELSVLRDGPL